MLNKELCLKCFKDIYSQLNMTSDEEVFKERLSDFERFWYHGQCRCIPQALEINNTVGSLIKINDLAPKCCPYIVEQMVS